MNPEKHRSVEKIRKCKNTVESIEETTNMKLQNITTSHYQLNLCVVKVPSRSGVSNTRPAGRMWPARCICAAREQLKNWEYCKFWSNLAYLRAFLVNCGPQELFTDKLRPAKHFFFGMWPSHKFEFETPGLDHRFLTGVHEPLRAPRRGSWGSAEITSFLFKISSFMHFGVRRHKF
jgi:hypothetical protein